MKSRPRTLALVLAGSVILTMAACGRSAQNVRIVLVTLDTLRFDRLMGDGERPSVMPHTLARARRGAYFARYYTAVPETQPSHASILSGLHPWQHGVTRNGKPLGAGIETVTERLRPLGFETRAVVSAFPVAARFGFDQGFDEFEDAFSKDFFALEEWTDVPVPESGFFSLGEAITDRAIASLDAARAPRQFFWFHYFDPHSPYGGNLGGDINRKHVYTWLARGAERAEVMDRVRKLYDADVAYLDRCLERLFRRLDEEADRFETHLVVVSDHGESLGEGDSIGHGFRLSDEQLRVPLIVVSPRVAPGEREDVAGSVDVAATLLALAGAPGAGVEGRDLTRPGPGRAFGMRAPPDVPPLRERRLDGRVHELDPLAFYAVEPGGEVVRGDARALWDDPPEGLAERFRRRFADFEGALRAGPSARALSAREEEGLRALGYLE